MKTYEYKDLLMIPYQTGPIRNNAYVIVDRKANQCVIIDPSYNFDQALRDIQEKGWQIAAVWLTHAHYDHLIGASFTEEATPKIPVAMHPDDQVILSNGGSARPERIGPCTDYPVATIHIADGMILKVGDYSFEVLHTPGHAPGHCCFYSKDAGWLFTGDLIFYHDYGRTDLIGGSQEVLLKSIRQKVMTLPDQTIIFPGHEMFTTVKEERQFYT